jgi:hypothetical protein
MSKAVLGVVLWLCCLLAAAGVDYSLDAKKQDPDVGLNMVQIVQARGYAIETHFVTTEDGYVCAKFYICVFISLMCVYLSLPHSLSHSLTHSPTTTGTF